MIAPLISRFLGLPRGARTAIIMVVTTMILSSMHVIIRNMTAELHPFEVAFFRNFFGLVVLAPVLIRNGLSALHTTRLPLHGLRSILQLSSMVTFFFALSLMPLAKATALSFTAPLFVTLFAAALLGEQIRLRRISAVMFGFLGMLVIVRPSVATIDVGSLMMIASSAGLAGMLIAIKRLSATESPVAITTYGALILTLVSLVPCILVWQWPSPAEFGWLFAIGVLGTSAHILMSQAMKQADASEVVPYDFTRLIWASLLGLIVFGEIPSWWTLAGGSIIFASATYIAYREVQVSRAKARALPSR